MKTLAGPSQRRLRLLRLQSQALVRAAAREEPTCNIVALWYNRLVVLRPYMYFLVIPGLFLSPQRKLPVEGCVANLRQQAERRWNLNDGNMMTLLLQAWLRHSRYLQGECELHHVRNRG